MNWQETEVKVTGEVDGECLPIQCVCGHGKKYWSFVIDIGETNPTTCPKCGRNYYFSNSIKVYCDVR